MAYTKLEFTKDWRDPDDFPTIETNETQVRADIQLLFDECKDAINDLSDDMDDAVPFTATYGVTSYAAVAAAVAAGLAVVAIDTQASDKTTLPYAAFDSSNNSYVFSGMIGDTRRSVWVLPNNTWNYNSTALAHVASPNFTGTPTSTTPTTGNNSTRIATTAFVKATLDAARGAWDALVTMFTGITAVTTTLTSSNSTIPTSKAVLDAMSASGYGDMLKSYYDTTNTGNKVDTAINAEKLGGVVASSYIKSTGAGTDYAKPGLVYASASVSSLSDLTTQLSSWVSNMTAHTVRFYEIQVPSGVTFSPFAGAAGYSVEIYKYSSTKAVAVFARSATVGVGRIAMAMTAAGTWTTPSNIVLANDTAPVEDSAKLLTSGALYTTFQNRLGRVDDITASNGSYSTPMARAIKATTTDPGVNSTLTSGTILIVYEA